MNGKVVDFFEILSEDNSLIEREMYKNFGMYPVVSGQTKNNGIVGYIKKYRYDGEFLTWATYGIKAGTVFYRNFKFSIGRNCAGLKLRDKYKGKINLEYMKLLLQKKIIREMGSKNCRGNASTELVSNIDIKIPDDIKEQESIVALFHIEKEKYMRIKEKKKKILKITKLLSKLKCEKERIVFCKHFITILGKQFTEKEAYYSYGNIPVYTASIFKPSYFVKDNINGKIKVNGPCLIWGRKGNAGKLNLIENEMEFYITDVSGIIYPKKEVKGLYNLKFLRYYLESEFMDKIKSKENNPQLNKTDIESKMIPFPSKGIQDEIVNIIDRIKSEN